jgi:putative tryptophan/tyrosine transport system substrate-binding protein
VLIGALTQRGYTLGQNLTYEARGAAGKLSQMPQQMQELKTANVDVVVTVSYPAALIAKGGPIRAAPARSVMNSRRCTDCLHPIPH